MVRAKIRDLVINEDALYYEYTIPDGMRPDILSNKYYGQPDYVWAIFYANNIYNPLTEWPYFQKEFEDYIIRKYGSMRRALITTHHYLLEDKYIIDQKTFESGQYTPSEIREVSVFDYEHSLNQEKRNIKVLDAVYLRQIVSELTNIF
jgi:hypothetical protein